MVRHRLLEAHGFKREDLPDNWSYPDIKRLQDVVHFLPRLWRRVRDRYKYGFYNCETWNLDVSFSYWLLERVLVYKELSSSILDMEYKHIPFQGEKISINEACDLLIESCQDYLEGNDTRWFDERFDKIIDYWKQFGQYIWW